MKTNILTFILGILLSISAFAQLKSVDYKDGPQTLKGWCGSPVTPLSKHPGVLILPAWMGIDDHAKESAVELSKLGYHTFVADIYGVGNMPTNFNEAGQKAGYYKKNFNEYQQRIQLALNQLIAQGANSNEIVVIGYCFGGTGAIEAARAQMNVKGIVSFHGGLSKDESRPVVPIKAHVLILHGADDPYVPEKDIKAFQDEMRTAKADWEMTYYANAVHSFTDKNAGNDNSKGAAYNQVADHRSWNQLLVFLQEVL